MRSGVARIEALAAKVFMSGPILARPSIARQHTGMCVTRLMRGQQLLPPDQQFLECRHETLPELRQIVSSHPARCRVSRHQAGIGQLPQISREFFLADRRNGPEQLVVPLGTVQQQRPQDQQLPFASDNLDGFFDGALYHTIGHSIMLLPNAVASGCRLLVL